jgi:hypothetical protein
MRGAQPLSQAYQVTYEEDEPSPDFRLYRNVMGWPGGRPASRLVKPRALHFQVTPVTGP